MLSIIVPLTGVNIPSNMRVSFHILPALGILSLFHANSSDGCVVVPHFKFNVHCLDE